MKNKKMFLVGAVAMAALGVFAAHGEMPPYPNFGLPRVEEMMFLVLQVGIVIFAARLGGAFASWLKLPSILGELAAGIITAGYLAEIKADAKAAIAKVVG